MAVRPKIMYFSTQLNTETQDGLVWLFFILIWLFFYGYFSYCMAIFHTNVLVLVFQKSTQLKLNRTQQLHKELLLHCYF